MVDRFIEILMKIHGHKTARILTFRTTNDFNYISLSALIELRNGPFHRQSEDAELA